MDKKLKIFLVLAVIVLALLPELKRCGSNQSSQGDSPKDVSSLYGTYTAEKRFSDGDVDVIKIVLKPESVNEWTKCAEYYSKYTVWTDSKGKNHFGDRQSITYSWDLEKGYVQTYYKETREREVIGLKTKKIYPSYGAFLDDRDGLPYKFSK